MHRMRPVPLVLRAPRVAAFAVAAACSAGLLLVPDAQPPALAAPKGVSLEGRVLAADRKTAVPGAAVLLVHLQSRTVSRVNPTEKSGTFRAEGLASGYHQVAVETPEGLWVVPTPLLLEPGRSRHQDVRLLPPPEPAAGEEGAETGILVPSLGRRAQALAELPGEDKTPFLKTQLGITTLAGGGVLLLVLLL
jgi:hypothetical protein